jgi:hypothetical protein
MNRQQAESSHQTSSFPKYISPLFSCIIPCSGQLLKRHWAGGLRNVALGIGLGLMTWMLFIQFGVGAAILFAMLGVLPWWCLQAYEASFSHPHTFFQTVARIWQYAHDIHFLGGLFLLTAMTDLYIILGNPEYALTIFCTKPSGIPGILAKAQSPILHLGIGYGFLRLRRWSLWLYFVYAGFGLLNASANFACFGFGRIRTIFLLTLLAFTLYVYVRRNSFSSP